ncbi:FAD-dependent oxidoreductase [Bizionia argentinensis JUB59]|uniref:FAD-dependent oxidoreductase n=1 Tax=Bizionia argentinensis JUB59 TaxID=1046627 RepID=G2EDF3_9FLAO|nr:FAD-dependent oxidoreductase [Bizionia argentinensis]EGV43466.1 FAD-dependent oxidoreductase [Bizionia argentinensis JUB59]
MKIDYFIVGLGLAGVAFCEQLRKANKTFLVFDNASQQSSIVAAGMYNPVILKRFTEVWMADEQLALALPYYKELEELLRVKLDYKLKLYRKFASVEEQNTWFTATDKPKLESYMSTKLVPNDGDHIDAPFNLGEVFHAGRVDTAALITNYKDYLESQSQLITDGFHYEDLQINSSTLHYKNHEANHIVFCEGFGLKQNPFFKYLPLNGTKGEVLGINAPDLKISYAIKSAVFIMPITNDDYYIGATYNRFDKTNSPTEAGKTELITKLKTFLTAPFTITSHKAGIRPTTNDRRPLVGTHAIYKNLHVLNGLGSRGVMIAPYAAEQLFNWIENKQALNPDISISRFPI